MLSGRDEVQAVLACDCVPSGEEFGEQRLLDVRDREACEAVVREWRPTHILHAAAVTAGDDETCFAVNAMGTSNMVRAAVEAGTVERMVVLSSSGVYGASQTSLPCDEEHPLDLSSAYAESKRSAELCALLAEARSGIALVAARVGPCYGSEETPSLFRPRQSLIAELRAALLSAKPVRVYGPGYARDWTHTNDLCAAMAGLLLAPRLQHRIYNVSSGIAVSSDELLETFEDFGLQVQRVSDAAQADLLLLPEHERKAMVIDRLHADTGFTPSIGLHEGIALLLQHDTPDAPRFRGRIQLQHNERGENDGKQHAL